jgi:hypothetical protein
MLRSSGGAAQELPGRVTWIASVGSWIHRTPMFGGAATRARRGRSRAEFVIRREGDY